MNKTGSLQDIALVAVVALVFAVVLLFAFKIITEVDNKIQPMDVIPDNAKTASTTLTSYYPGVMNNMFLFLVVGLAMVAFVLASLVRVNPVFIAFYLMALIIIIVICGVLSNIYQEIAATSQLSGFAVQLTFPTLILTYLPFFVGVFGSILAIIMYKQWQNQ